MHDLPGVVPAQSYISRYEPASDWARSKAAHGTKRTYRDGLLLVRFRTTADKHARVASAASVVNDPSRHLTINFVVLHNAAPS